MNTMDVLNDDNSISQGQVNHRSTSIRIKKQHVNTLGNKLLLSLPIGAFTIPVIFVMSAYLYATDKNTLKLQASRSVPFVSDIGDLRPQSGLFTFGLSLSSYFTLGIVVVRYFQIQRSKMINRRMNFLVLILGVLIVIGKLMVGSFQISGNRIAHVLGAFLYVLSSVLFISLQTFVSFKETAVIGNVRRLFLILRSLLSASMIIGIVIFGIFLLPPLVKYNRGKFCMAQIGEWCFAVCKMLFMLSFTVDFWNLQPHFGIIEFTQQTLN